MPHPVRPLLLLALAALPAPAQDDLRLLGGMPGGLRTNLTDSWGVLQFTVVNPTAAPRDARVSVLYPDRQAVRYARDVWVPPRAAVAAWLPVGPPPAQGPAIGREIEMVLSDRTGGADRTVFLPGMEKVQARPVPYRPRSPTTAVLFDYPTDEAAAEHPSRPTSRAAQVVRLVRIARAAVGLSEEVALLPPDELPPTPAAFDGTDHLVLAGNRLAADPAGRLAVRHWLEQGGRLWVMLHLVDPDTVLPLLGDELPFEVVDRVGLTTVRIHRPPGAPPAAGREFEEPVEQVRVIPGPADQVTHVANGWPAAFVRPVGRGRVVFTTLDIPAWVQPRPPVGAKGIGAKRPAEAAPPGPPVLTATTPLEEVAAELRPPARPHPFTAEDLRPLLTEEIGYTVPGRGVAAGILGGFLVALVALGVGLRRSRRPELVGWLAPAAALVAGGVFLGIGISSRRAVPPTTAVAAVADAVPGTGETAVNGLFALYQPGSGPVPLAARAGGLLDLDPEGLEGQARRRVQTDIGRWHLEDLSLPAGVRTGPFQHTARTGPISAVARFGPNGVEGQLTTAAFRDPADAVIATPAREPLAVRFAADGSFAAGPADQLAPDQFLAGAVLTDRQQRRQGVYRKLLTGPLPRHLDGRDFLLTWVEPGELPFVGQEGARTIGTVLLVVPLEFEPAPAGTRVTIPAAFVPYRRLAEGTLRTPTMESPYPAEMDLRFQLPPAARPLAVERATLHLRIRAPSRRVTVAGLVNGRPVPLFTEDSPAEPIRVEIADPAQLQQDADGGLLLHVAVTNAGGGQLDNPWKIESLGLEVVGTVGR